MNVPLNRSLMSFIFLFLVKWRFNFRVIQSYVTLKFDFIHFFFILHFNEESKMYSRYFWICRKKLNDPLWFWWQAWRLLPFFLLRFIVYRAILNKNRFQVSFKITLNIRENRNRYGHYFIMNSFAHRNWRKWMKLKLILC